MSAPTNVLDVPLRRNLADFDCFLPLLFETSRQNFQVSKLARKIRKRWNSTKISLIGQVSGNALNTSMKPIFDDGSV